LETSSEVSKLSGPLFLVRLEATPSVLYQSDQMLLTIEIGAQVDEVISDLAFLINSSGGERIAIIDLRSPGGNYRVKPNLNLRLQSKVVNLPFVEGDYSLGLWIKSTSIYNSFMGLLKFTILPDESSGGIVPRPAQHRGFIELQTATREISDAQ
jgi:hypothetical protein